MEECELWIGTFDFGYQLNPENYFTEGISDLPDLYIEAIRRNISIDLSPEEICELIKDQTPSLEWQRQVLIDLANRDLVSPKEFKLIESYWSYGFEPMNNELRYGSLSAPLNNIISRLPPLDKDITVFRYVHKYNYLPTDIGKIFTSTGYLSTTMGAFLTSKAICTSKIQRKKQMAIVKINVPKGTRAIYIPSNEKELLFSHNIQLKLTDYDVGKFVCKTNKDACEVINGIPFFTFEMIL